MPDAQARDAGNRASVAGLALAAGGGRRFGSPKALVEHQGELLVERAHRLLGSAGCRPVAVVIGAAAAEVRTRARLDPSDIVVNADWAEGIGSSLRAGLQALSAHDGVGAVVVALCDQPLVQPEAIRRLVDAWRAGAPIAVAAFDGEPRNPVLLDRSLWAGVAELAEGDVGARAFLRLHPELVTPVECGDVASSLDIDMANDLVLLTKYPEEGPPCN
jgi:nicotine blue oxidoreductase